MIIKCDQTFEKCSLYTLSQKNSVAFWTGGLGDLVSSVNLVLKFQAF